MEDFKNTHEFIDGKDSAYEPEDSADRVTDDLVTSVVAGRQICVDRNALLHRFADVIDANEVAWVDNIVTRNWFPMITTFDKLKQEDGFAVATSVSTGADTGKLVNHHEFLDAFWRYLGEILANDTSIVREDGCIDVDKLSSGDLDIILQYALFDDYVI